MVSISCRIIDAIAKMVLNNDWTPVLLEIFGVGWEALDPTTTTTITTT